MKPSLIFALLERRRMNIHRIVHKRLVAGERIPNIKLITGELAHDYLRTDNGKFMVALFEGRVPTSQDVDLGNLEARIKKQLPT